MEEQIQGLATLVAEAYANPDRRRASLEIMCEWGRVVLDHLPLGHTDRPSFSEALGAVKAIARDRPDELLSLLREWPGAPMIGDMSRRQVVRELRGVCESFRAGPNNPTLMAAWLLSHWALDAVERPKVAVKGTKEAALALLRAVRHATLDTADAAITACADVAHARLSPAGA